MSPQPKTGRTRATETSREPSSAGRSIFRSEALRHYQENQDKVVLPPLASPRVFVYLWILAGLTIVIGLILAGWSWIEPLVVGLT